MSAAEAGIYVDSKFRDVDIGAIMRVGHPDIEEGDHCIVEMIRELRRELARPLRILDVGSGSGHLSLLLARTFADCEVIANEVADAHVARARTKLDPFPNANVFDRSFDEWKEPADAIISWGSHHHLSHDYLVHVRDVLAPDGLLVIGDEMCPEYLTPADQQRLRSAEIIQIVDGYIFDRPADIEAYRSNGFVPEWNLGLEQARRKALWEWYKFVGDYAVEHDVWTVLMIELQIARDDLITSFAGEHKTSRFLLERELELSGFSITKGVTLGNRPPALQSFVIYTCRPNRRETN
jgi:SAM-dependent methyltransferase